MLELPKLRVITDSKLPNATSLKTIILERRILKTQLKLLQIEAFDRDLQTLDKNGLTLNSLDLEDFLFTPTYNLFVPVKDRIVVGEDTLKLKSYLIYLSYLYNFNFLEVYEQNPNYLYRLIFSLHLDEFIKQDLFRLLNKEESAYFSSNIKALNNAHFRETLAIDEKNLRR